MTREVSSRLTACMCTLEWLLREGMSRERRPRKNPLCKEPDGCISLYSSIKDLPVGTRMPRSKRLTCTHMHADGGGPFSR